MLGLAVAALVTVWRHFRRSTNRSMPYSARHDIKARRLWRGDPDAYRRKYGTIDQQSDEKKDGT
jgi:hypothetical protein